MWVQSCLLYVTNFYWFQILDWLASWNFFCSSWILVKCHHCCWSTRYSRCVSVRYIWAFDTTGICCWFSQVVVCVCFLILLILCHSSDKYEGGKMTQIYSIIYLWRTYSFMSHQTITCFLQHIGEAWKARRCCPSVWVHWWVRDKLKRCWLQWRREEE